MIHVRVPAHNSVVEIYLERPLISSGKDVEKCLTEEEEDEKSEGMVRT